jgi:Tol biopolymer transport system component
VRGGPRHTSGVRAWATRVGAAWAAGAAAVALWPAVAASGPLSPTSSRVLYDSSRTGRYRIYVKAPCCDPVLLVHDRGGDDFAPAVSPGGRWVAFTRRVHGNYDLYLADLTGQRGRVRLTRNPAIDAFPSWSPSGALAFESNRGRGYDIYVYEGGRVRRLTTNPAVDGLPAWSPDGKEIAFDSNRSGHYQIMVVPASGNGVATAVTPAAAHKDVQPVWSPDGSRIAFTSNRSGTFQIYVVDLATQAVTRVTTSPADDVQPAWSRNGTRIVFTRMRAGRNRLYTVNPDGSGLQKISTTAGELPEWSVHS